VKRFRKRGRRGECNVEMAVEVIRGNEALKRNQDRVIQVSLRGRTDHGWRRSSNLPIPFFTTLKRWEY